MTEMADVVSFYFRRTRLVKKLRGKKSGLSGGNPWMSSAEALSLMPRFRDRSCAAQDQRAEAIDELGRKAVVLNQKSHVEGSIQRVEE